MSDLADLRTVGFKAEFRPKQSLALAVITSLDKLEADIANKQVEQLLGTGHQDQAIIGEPITPNRKTWSASFCFLLNSFSFIERCV